METYALSLSLKLPDCLKVKDFLECNLNPVVVLKDFRKSLQKVTLGTSPATLIHGDYDARMSSGDGSSEASKLPFNRDDSRSRSTSSASLTSSRRDKRATKRKRQSWDPSLEYEIEKIVGYHRDKRSRMWYFIKWKDWSNEYNTFEPIDNLTGCNYKLMRYFEKKYPSIEDFQKMNAEVKLGLKDRDIYKRLLDEGCKTEHLEEFSNECLSLTELFEATDVTDLENKTLEEYEYIVRCLIGMCAHQDPGLLWRAQNYKLLLKLIKLRRKQLQSNAAIEKQLNACEQTLLAIENHVDLEKFPDLEYIVDIVPGEGGVVPEGPLLGCECPEGCNPRSRCCGKMSDSAFAYNGLGRLRTMDRMAIYECNSRCRCPPTCPNRVVQHGRRVPLCIFKTRLCGWGVKTLEKIPKGSFVCQYVGELISDSEARRRDVRYCKEKRAGYLFDLDFFQHARLDMYCIDATERGNVARFINHSCDPNLVVYPVWIDSLEPNIHLLAFFAKRNIQKDEEINFDYENLQEDAMKKKDEDKKGRGVRMVSDLRCQCKAPKCRQWVFGNK